MAQNYYTLVTPTADTPFLTYVTDLSGELYRFDYRYNQRRDVWEVSLFDSNDTPVCYGRTINTETDILQHVTTENRPPGKIFCFTQDREPPNLNNFATSTLYYVVDSDLDGETV